MLVHHQHLKSFFYIYTRSLAVTIIVNDGSRKRNCSFGFELERSLVTEKRNNKPEIDASAGLLGFFLVVVLSVIGFGDGFYYC